MGAEVLAAVTSDIVFLNRSNADDNLVASSADRVDDLVVVFREVWVNIGEKPIFQRAIGWIDGGDLDQEYLGIEVLEQSVCLDRHLAGKGKVKRDFPIARSVETFAILSDSAKVPFLHRDELVSQVGISSMDRELELETPSGVFLAFDLYQLLEEVL